jgi:hypothetical protein
MEIGRQAMHWRKVTDGQRGGDWSHLIDELTRKTYPTQVWRHNVSGDLSGDGVTIDANKLADLVNVNTGKRGFTYTHYDTIENAENREAVKAANAGGFVVNLSGNNLDHADELAGLGVAPVVSILPSEYGIADGETVPEYKTRLSTLPKTTPQGRTVTICPATYLGGVSCATCKLCAAPNRRAVVGFPADGIRKKQADAIANQ